MFAFLCQLCLHLAYISFAATSAAPSFAPSISIAPTHQSNWQYIQSYASVWNPKLLTDGVLLFTLGQKVYKLSPNKYGDYASGTFTQVASLPQNYGPLYCASAVLPDGRVIVQGGEYNYPSGRSITGAVYNPFDDSWVPLNAPTFLFGEGGSSIADSSSVVLPNGQFMLQGWGTNTAVLNAKTLTWQQSFHPGKLGGWGNEEGWVLLPNGYVLSVDNWISKSSELLNPTNNTNWIYAGSTVSDLPVGAEIGPSVLRPDGSVLAVGAGGNSAIYNYKTGIWKAGPQIVSPLGFNCLAADAPGALLPNGNVLIACAGGNGSTNLPYGSGPVYWYEFDGSKFNIQTSAPSGAGIPYVYNMIVLPTGQVLQTSISGTIDIYNPGDVNAYVSSWAPVITTFPSTVTVGQTYVIHGILFNGMSQASMYGDDFQGATNYPLVRIKHTNTGYVYYCRTFNHSSMAVASYEPVFTYFTVPATFAVGAGKLVVVANGIPSLPVDVIVEGPTLNPTTNPSTYPTAATVSPPIFQVLPSQYFNGSTYKLYSSISQQMSTAMTLSAFIQTTSTSTTIMTIGRAPCCFSGEFVFQISSTGLLNFWDYTGSVYCLSGTSTVSINTGTSIISYRRHLCASMRRKSSSCGICEERFDWSFLRERSTRWLAFFFV